MQYNAGLQIPHLAAAVDRPGPRAEKTLGLAIWMSRSPRLEAHRDDINYAPRPRPAARGAPRRDGPRLRLRPAVPEAAGIIHLGATAATWGITRISSSCATPAAAREKAVQVNAEPLLGRPGKATAHLGYTHSSPPSPPPWASARRCGSTGCSWTSMSWSSACRACSCWLRLEGRPAHRPPSLSCSAATRKNARRWSA